ncbi:hypothetical protein BGZ76_001764 [Entomortierella beljakovae]|nr:hypothetical protein BGZ76_001764 [Entomortierella beljakovae]
MSVDHKPTNTDESTRILVAGGSIESGRVNGMAGMSRALGDFDYKSNDFLKPEEQLIIRR